MLVWLLTLALAQESPVEAPSLPELSDGDAVGGRPEVERIDGSTIAASFTEQPVAIVVRGGASLGSYEAGYLYAFDMGLRGLRRDRKVPYDVITGASAGALNTLVAAVSACQKPVRTPEDSLFWTWTRVFVDPRGRSKDPWNLFRRSEVGATHVLSRQPFLEAAGVAWEAMDQPARWLDDPCEIDLGFVVSRLRARRVPIRESVEGPLSAHRQTEKIGVRLAHTPGQEVTFTPLRPLDSGGEPSPASPLYLHLGRGEVGEPVPYEDVVSVLAASSGFPFAFEETAIPHREWDLKGRLVMGPRTERARFVDGGLLANLPVRLARTLGQWRSWQAGVPQSPARTFLVVDPTIENWTRAIEPSRGSPAFEPDAIQLGMAMAWSYVRSAQDAELLVTLDENPALMQPPVTPGEAFQRRDRLLLPGRRTIPASQWFGAFLGLFEQDFRWFDFYLGMLEAREQFRGVSDDAMAALEPGEEGGLDSAAFRCFVDWEDSSEGFTREMVRQGEPESCVPFDRTRPEAEVGVGNMVPLLRTATSYRLWTESEDYEAVSTVRFDTWVRMLADHGFRWRVLRHSASGEVIRQQLRDFALLASGRLSVQQGSRWLLVSAVTRFAANTYAYRPPRFLPFVGLNIGWGVEAGFGVSAGRWVRPTLGLKVLDLGRRVEDLTGGAQLSVQPTPFVRVDFTPMKDPMFSVEPYLSYGVQVPVTFGGDVVGVRHALTAGVHLVGLEWIYGTIGLGGVVDQTAMQPYDSSALSGFTERVVIDLSLGLRFPR